MQTDRRTRRTARRGLFKLWGGLTIAFATALALALPFIQGDRFAFLAGVPVVALNLLLLASALGWLIWHVFVAGPKEEPGRPPSAAANDTRRSARH